MCLCQSGCREMHAAHDHAIVKANKVGAEPPASSNNNKPAFRRLIATAFASRPRALRDHGQKYGGKGKRA